MPSLLYQSQMILFQHALNLNIFYYYLVFFNTILDNFILQLKINNNIKYFLLINKMFILLYL